MNGLQICESMSCRDALREFEFSRRSLTASKTRSSLLAKPIVTFFTFFLFIFSCRVHAETVIADSITVDPSSVSVGGLTNGVTFGGPRTVRLPSPRHPVTETFPSGVGISSNRGISGNRGGLDFYTALLATAIPRLSITAGGYVGIGTISPSSLLEIVSSGSVQVALRSTDSSGGNWAIRSSAGASSSSSNAGGLFEILDLSSGTATARLQIDNSGTVSVPVLNITGGSDLAEPFSIKEASADPGSVMVIDDAHPGQLRISTTPYDTRVAGVISGAGGIHPALVLTQESTRGDQAVALSGRVYVLAEATSAAIKPGDLLTTSSVRGYCMKASNPGRSTGAILGKAMSTLPEGRGFVLALVSLQ